MNWATTRNNLRKHSKKESYTSQTPFFFIKQRDSPHPPGGDLCTVVNMLMKNARITMRTNDKPGVEPARCPAHQKLLRLHPPPHEVLHTPLRLTDPLLFLCHVPRDLPVAPSSEIVRSFPAQSRPISSVVQLAAWIRLSINRSSFAILSVCRLSAGTSTAGTIRISECVIRRVTSLASFTSSR